MFIGREKELSSLNKLFSRAGFTKGCIEQAYKMGNVSLVSYDDILNHGSKEQL